MRLKSLNSLRGALLLMLLTALPALAQNAQVSVGKQAGRIPKSCQSLVPASIEGTVDVPALVKEAYCKGAGDTLTEYSYTMISASRSVDKKGQTKQESTTYEVFIPSLKSGTRGKGVLVVTGRNGVPLSAAELEKERAKAGKKLEKAEEENARATAEADSDPNVQ